MLCVYGYRAEFRAEYGKHCQHPDQFRGKRRFEYKAGQPDDAADLMGGDAFLQHAPLQQGDFPAREGCDKGGNGDDAESADLNQNQNDSLAEDGSVGCGVLDNEACHAHSRGCSEQRVLKGRPPARFRRDGKRQQKGSCQDDSQKADDDHLKG